MNTMPIPAQFYSASNVMDKELLIKTIKLKMQLSKRAPKKYYGIHRRTSADHRIYGSFMYCRATTGRWASQGVNFQNIKRPEYKDVNAIIHAFGRESADYLDWMWGDTIKALSAAVRGMITAKPGHRLLASDFSSIESRVLAWLAGEESKLEIFRTHGKIYEHLAGKIFGIPMEDVKDGSDERFGGKISELACGFQGGWKALQRMAGQYDVDLEDDFCQEIVTKWRRENPNIENYWTALQDTAVKAIQNPGEKFLVEDQLEGKFDELPPVKYQMWQNYLCCQLPSGRVLWYNRPTLKTRTITLFKIDGDFPRNVVYNKDHWTVSEFYAEAKKYGAEVKSFDTPSIRFWGLNSETYQWQQQYTYGGSLSENVTQAVARDLLAEAMLRVTKAGYPIVMHVHDEIVSELPYGQGNIKEFDKLMAVLPHWATRLPVAAKGYEAERYKK